MTKKNIWKRFLPIALLLVVLAAVGVTGATIVHKVSLENPIKTPKVEGTIEEEPSGTTKNTQFKNTGEADVFLRVAYADSWSYTVEGETQLLPNEAQKKDGTGTMTVAEPNWNETNNWSLGKDGWLYYKKVLKVGETTPKIVEAVSFKDSATLDTLVDAAAYKNGKYELHFTMEVVQASDEIQVSEDAIRTLWGSEYTPTLTEGFKADTYLISWPKTTSGNPGSSNQ